MRGLGGYQIRFSENEYLDCMNFSESMCMASMSNSPTDCWDKRTKEYAVANSYLSISHKYRRATLKALSDIGPNVEFLWTYGDEYRYPSFE